MTKVKNKTTNIYTEWRPLIDALSDEDAGKLLKDILKYQSNEDVDNSNPIWVFIKSKIDEYNKNGKEISKSRSEAGKKGMIKRWGITNDNKCYQMLSNDSKCYQMIASDNKNNNKIKENKIKENKYIIQDDLQLETQDGNQDKIKSESSPLISKKEKKYIFNGLTVRLNEKDYNSWKEEYNLLDLDYELKQIDNYLQMEENKSKQKDWFFFAKAWLNKNQKREYDKLPKGIDGKPIKGYHEW